LTADALANLGDGRAVLPLVERLADRRAQNPRLVQGTAGALGKLLQTLKQAGTPVDPGTRTAALAELARLVKTSPEDSVRQAAARALALCEAVEIKEDLLAAFREALRSGQAKRAHELKECLGAIDPKQAGHLADLLNRTSQLWSQQRRKILLDDR